MVKQVIKEYHKGQQLMLPFDGNSEPYNYMQYIEYLEQIGKYGKLPVPKITINQISQNDDMLFECGVASLYESVDEVFDIYKIEELIEWIKNNYGTDVFTEEFAEYDYDINNFDISSLEDLYSLFNEKYYVFQAIKTLGKERLNGFLSMIKTNENGQIYCERVIDLPKLFGRWHQDGYFSDTYNTNDDVFHKQDFYQMVTQDYPGIGECWTYSKNGGEAYCSAVSNGTEITLKGWVNPEDVEWSMCIELEYSGEEELRLKSNAIVQVDEIEVIENDDDEHETYGCKLPIKGSILLNVCKNDN